MWLVFRLAHWNNSWASFITWLAKVLFLGLKIWIWATWSGLEWGLRLVNIVAVTFINHFIILLTCGAKLTQTIFGKIFWLFYGFYYCCLFLVSVIDLSLCPPPGDVAVEVRDVKTQKSPAIPRWTPHLSSAGPRTRRQCLSSSVGVGHWSSEHVWNDALTQAISTHTSSHSALVIQSYVKFITSSGMCLLYKF